MSDRALSSSQARRLYDRIGKLYDLATYFEGNAKAEARRKLDLHPGHRLLNAGAGSGVDHDPLQRAVSPGGIAIALDLSEVMAQLTRQRTGAPSVQADLRRPPFAPGTFDRIFIAYVLDLISANHHRPLLLRAGQLLAPDGRIAVLALTEGVGPFSRALVALWKGLYSVSPTLCAGCRPLELRETFKACGYRQIERTVVTELGVPSEIISARAP